VQPVPRGWAALPDATSSLTSTTHLIHLHLQEAPLRSPSREQLKHGSSRLNIDLSLTTHQRVLKSHLAKDDFSLRVPSPRVVHKRPGKLPSLPPRPRYRAINSQGPEVRLMQPAQQTACLIYTALLVLARSLLYVPASKLETSTSQPNACREVISKP